MTISTPVDVAAIDPDSADVGAVAHYGDPMREQRTLAHQVGLVDRSHRGVLAIPGPDRLTWLHSLSSQHLSGLAPFTGSEMLLLSPHGHVEQHAVLLDDGETTWLDVEPARAAPLLEFLRRMQFRTRVDPVDVTTQWAVLSLVGPATPQALTQLGVAELAAPDLLAVPGPKFATGAVEARPSVRYAVGRLPGGGFARRMSYGADLLVPREQVADLVRAAQTPLAGIWAFEALRVADRRARLGLDTDHRTLPAEVGWIATAVHLAKGCYRGQETVARVHHLGKPPRRLVLVHLDGVATHELPAVGTPVRTVDGRPVGFVGSSARHFELGMIALALLKRSVPDDAALRIGDATAAIDPG